jgi:hypothetical protein
MFIFFIFNIAQVKLGTSEPIGSVEFRRFLEYRIPVQISSDEFRSVPIGSVDFRRIPGRKSTESIGSVAGNERKQPVPAVGTVDLGGC